MRKNTIIIVLLVIFSGVSTMLVAERNYSNQLQEQSRISQPDAATVAALDSAADLSTQAGDSNTAPVKDAIEPR